MCVWGGYIQPHYIYIYIYIYYIYIYIYILYIYIYIYIVLIYCYCRMSVFSFEVLLPFTKMKFADRLTLTHIAKYVHLT